MNLYLAIIFFCVGPKCGLFVNTQEAHPNLEACQDDLIIMVQKINQAGADFTYPACAPLKFMRTA